MTSHLIKEGHYELFPHQSDIGIQGVGWTKEEAFVQAALALSSISGDLEKVRDDKVSLSIAEPLAVSSFCWIG